MYSLVSFSHSVKGRTGLAELRHKSGRLGLGCAFFFASSYAAEPFWAPAGGITSGISTVAIGAAEAHRSGGVHRRRIGLAVAGDASGAVAIGFFLRFAEADWSIAVRAAARRESRKRR